MAKKVKDKPQSQLSRLLSNKRDDIIVPRAKEVLFSSDDPECKELIHEVRIRDFKDLQELEIIPKRIREDEMVEAIRLDDREALEWAKRNYNLHLEEDCNCKSHDRKPNLISDSKRFEYKYKAFRKDYNPELSRLYSRHYKKEFSWNDIQVKHARNWTLSVISPNLQLRPKVQLGLVNDIIIEHGGKLNISSNITMLMKANRLRIHTGGQIVVYGSYLYLNCSSAEGHLN